MYGHTVKLECGNRECTYDSVHGSGRVLIYTRTSRFDSSAFHRKCRRFDSFPFPHTQTGKHTTTHNNRIGQPCVTVSSGTVDWSSSGRLRGPSSRDLSVERKGVNRMIPVQNWQFTNHGYLRGVLADHRTILTSKVVGVRAVIGKPVVETTSGGLYVLVGPSDKSKP